MDNGTIVPLIISSDKTLVTNQQGDKSAYPVYLTVRNLAASVRNASARPGTIIVAMLLVIYDGDVIERTNLIHYCLRMIFDRVSSAIPGDG
jgi:hypothetical protein